MSNTSAKRKPRDYTIVWQFKDDDYLKLDGVSATTATRAINKFIKALSDEYAFDRRDLIIAEVYIGDR